MNNKTTLYEAPHRPNQQDGYGILFDRMNRICKIESITTTGPVDRDVRVWTTDCSGFYLHVFNADGPLEAARKAVSYLFKIDIDDDRVDSFLEDIKERFE
jgi:hypothetical protein